MSTPIQCSGCGKRYKVGGNLAGQRVRCGCGETLIVPALQPPGASGDVADDQLDESLFDVIAAGGPASDQEAAADDISDDLLDETIWDTDRKVERAEAEADVDPSPVAEGATTDSPVADNRPRPTVADDNEDEPATFWDRFKSPSRELIAWLAIGYGAVMAFILFAMTVPAGLFLYRLPGLSLAILIGTRLVWIALAALIAVGGVLIRKRHPLGPACAGLGGAGTCFSWLWSLLWAFLPLHVFLAYFTVQFVFIYSIPTYIIYWCLKEEEEIDEAARRDDFYAIRESLKDRMIEENQKEWESK